MLETAVSVNLPLTPLPLKAFCPMVVVSGATISEMSEVSFAVLENAHPEIEVRSGFATTTFSSVVLSNNRGRLATQSA